MPAPRARASRRRLRLVPGWVRPHRRLGLRARVTAAFALSALLLSVLLALITYALTRSSVLHSEDTAARRQTFVNASYLRGGLRSSKSDVTQLLSSLGTTAGSSSVLYYKGQWYASSLALGRDALPTSLR
ncbi:MAG: hypothetical protein ACRD0J_06690, partial [Acidimicrobiales bacterium]